MCSSDLFIDEIHRFNRAQQDSFLPYVEDGTIVLVGATTENPSFELNGALLSRCRVFVLRRLDEAALTTLAERAERANGRPLPLEAETRQALIAMADGDGRYLLNLIEQLQTVRRPLDVAGLARLVQQAPRPGGTPSRSPRSAGFPCPCSAQTGSRRSPG